MIPFLRLARAVELAGWLAYVSDEFSMPNHIRKLYRDDDYRVKCMNAMGYRDGWQQATKHGSCE